MVQLPIDWSNSDACDRLAPGMTLRAKDHDDRALRDEVGTPGPAATDTSASSAVEVTRALLDAVARTSAVTELTLAWLPGVARPRR
jgi:hypothetical protein